MIRILIVEDEFRIREGLSALINKMQMGCQVVGEAENGYEGLKLVQDLEPDVVITDIQMPKSDGLKMMEKIRDMGIECRFVIISGYAKFEYAQAGIRLGVEDYLLKPITITAVKELLQKLSAEEKPAEEKVKAGTEYSPMVAEMVRTIREEYGRILRLDQFAERFRVTSQYLSNLFARETGMPFSDYLKEVRMKKAQELLLQTDLKIYEVACAVGYPDQKYFSRVFREYTGISARQFVLQNCEKR